MQAHFLRPSSINGFPVDYAEADPEIGGIDVYIWKTERREDGIMVHCPNWQAVHKMMRDIQRPEAGQ